MIVSRVMTKNPVTVRPEVPVSEARSLMDKERVSKLPVLDRNNVLVGLVTRQDLLKSGPSAATSLDMYEISYLLSRLTVEKIMERKVITVEESAAVEEAARILADHNISCLPVMRGNLLVGIVTDTDLLHVFVNAYGARYPGVRLTISMDERPGQLAKFAQAIAAGGGNIVSFVTTEGDDLSHRRGTLKITGMDRAAVEAAVQGLAVVEDIRE